MDYRTGYYAISKAGHDKGKTYIIWNTEDEYVYLVNGITKTMDEPKKKKKKHVQIQCCMDDEVEWKLNNNCKITDDDIMEALRRHLQRG
ncbi:MAG: hypothetical protein UHS41_05860 [Lachnospiraceae bacterium]|nr:hypothetical protein [Lachnospiraceae bacterium]